MATATATEQPRLYCQACGKRIHPKSHFCRHCGATVAERPADQSNQVAVQHPAEQQKDKASDAEPKAETTIWQGRPDWRAFAGSWVAWLIVSIATLYAAGRYNGGGGPLVQAVWVFVGGSAAGLFVRTALIVYGRRYRLTSERLFIHRGILLRITDQIELLRVDDVRTRQNIIDRVVKTGTLEIFSTDETDETIHLTSIADPDTVAEHVRNHTHEVRKERAVAVEHI